VYHSGTVGAALTARNGRVSGIAVSQAVAGFGVEGQGWDEMLVGQKWESAATVAAAFVDGFIRNMPVEPVVVNINVPNKDISDIKGWKTARLGHEPPRRMSTARLEPKVGHEGTFHVRMAWGEAAELPIDTDGGMVENDFVSVSYLGPILNIERADVIDAESSLTKLISDAR
jgi:5'-nucleotidase